MKKIKLVNLSKLGTDAVSDDFPPFTIDSYEFHNQASSTRQSIYVYTPNMAARSNRVHKQNAYIQFSHKQLDSIIFKGGRIGTRARLTLKRKFIEDILILGSLLTAQNWCLYSRRNTSGYPVTPTNHLRSISRDYQELQQDLPILIAKLKDSSWQQQFDGSFHLISLLNHSNINNSESRFLSMVVIWEFIYAKLFGESENLHKIIKGLLEYFWPNKVNTNIFQNSRIQRISKNFFYVLRNQLAHSGKLPINRPYAESWMCSVPFEAPFGSMTKDIMDYLRFFDELTQVIVMKTMDFHPENRHLFNTFNFSDNLNNFLSTGRL